MALNDLFETFIGATTLRGVLSPFRQICSQLDIRPGAFTDFYPALKRGINGPNGPKGHWKAQSIFNKIDKKANNRVYHKPVGGSIPCVQSNNILAGDDCLVIGGGPCGLRTAIELQLLGGRHVVVVEKRDRFSRNNVLHLWPMVIADLKSLAAKKFYGKFCAGSIDHVSIRQMQLILLKIALIIGCEFIDSVTFEEICPKNLVKHQTADCCPCFETTDTCECCCHIHAASNRRIGCFAHFASTVETKSATLDRLHSYHFDILIGADGRRNLLSGNFARKEFRGRLAIAITANFINSHTLQEAQVPEISGISFIYRQDFFKSLYDDLGIDLENIVYYKDDTHYFVMTAKKSSLLNRQVLINDYAETRTLLSPDNINRVKLMEYAKDAARWTTGLEPLNFAFNHYGEADVAMFDFTSMYAAENACRAKRIRHMNSTDEGLLLMGLVGDSLLEPFWPTGSGAARGFFSSMDAAWMARQWSLKKCKSRQDVDDILSVLSERESIYRLLAQTKSENLSQNYALYTINPATRYPNLNSSTLLPNQVKHLLYDHMIGPVVKRRQNMAAKRMRRATIATATPFSIESLAEKRPNSFQVDSTFEESLDQFEENYREMTSDSVLSSSVPNRSQITQELCMSPSASNLLTLGKSRAKDIEIAMKNRRQQQSHLKRSETLDHRQQVYQQAEKQYQHHVQQTLKSKAAWLLDSDVSSSSNSSSHMFQNRIKDLEAKLHAASGMSSVDESGDETAVAKKKPKMPSGVNVLTTSNKLEQLLSRDYQDKKLQEKIKQEKLKTRDIKCIGRLSGDEWNVICWEDEGKGQHNQASPNATSPPLPARPKEMLEIFNDRLSDMKTKLERIDDRHKPERKATKNDEWIALLKNELNTRSSSSSSMTAKPPIAPSPPPQKEADNPFKSQFTQTKRTPPTPPTRKSSDRPEAKHQQPVSDVCVRCTEKVATVDRILLSGVLLHRACLTCSRCGVTLRLSEVRNNVTETDSATFNYMCILCTKNTSNNRMTASFDESTSNQIEYESRLKERMKWKEQFLLNNNYNQLGTVTLKEDTADALAKNQVSERIEYENTSHSFELFDDDELTKLLNLESDQWDTDENDSSDETDSDWTGTDSTDNDIDSDQFDMEEEEAKSRTYVVPEIVVNDDDEPTSEDVETAELDSDTNKEPTTAEPTTDTTSDPEDTDTLTSDGFDKIKLTIYSDDEKTTKEEKTTDRPHQAPVASDEDETNTTVSSLSCDFSSHFDDLNLVSCLNDDPTKETTPTATPYRPPLPAMESPAKVQFKVAQPKLTLFNFNLNDGPTYSPPQPPTVTYSKIPVLASRVTAANQSPLKKATGLPSYSGSFTEKMLQRCKSTPSLGSGNWSTVRTPAPKAEIVFSTAYGNENSAEAGSQAESPSTSLPFADSDSSPDGNFPVMKSLTSAALPRIYDNGLHRTTAPRASIDEALSDEDEENGNLMQRMDSKHIMQWLRRN